jgi:pimeloyl-ACP methyl ester carboxylesterase
MLVDGPDSALWVDVLGRGDPISVWAHGVTSSVAELAPMAARTPGTRVLFDFRGHGRSSSPPEEAGYDHAAMRRDLTFVADEFGAGRAFGVSMGAGVICSWLEDDPTRFDRVCLMIPAVLDRANGGGADWFPELAVALEGTPLEEAADAALRSPAYQPLFDARPQWRERVRARILGMNATGVPRALRAYASGAPPVRDAASLRRVVAPALVLGHEGDPIHEAAVARRLGALLPNAAVRIWEEPLAMLDDPGAFAALVGDFLGAP